MNPIKILISRVLCDLLDDELLCEDPARVLYEPSTMHGGLWQTFETRITHVVGSDVEEPEGYECVELSFIERLDTRTALVAVAENAYGVPGANYAREFLRFGRKS